MRIAKHIEQKTYEVISLNASKHSVVLVISTALPRAELHKRGFPISPLTREEEQQQQQQDDDMKEARQD